MSLFKKPKKNIRRRIGTDDDDEREDENGVKIDAGDNTNGLQNPANASKVKEHKRDKRKQTLLSFEEELNDADDGEIFQVKKSSHSKKIMKLLDKERKKKKETKKDDITVIDDGIAKTIKDEDLVLVVKNTQMPRILNGREAEMAELDEVSSEEEEKFHKFSQPDHVKLLLESGRIPDAAMIHAARKRRQLAREMGSDYIPVETPKADSNKSRLVRDDDNDASDDEERITMEVNTSARDKEKRREAFLAAQTPALGEESDKGEDDEWESQQIRKGVTGAQIAAVQQETLYQQYAMPAISLNPPQPILPAPAPTYLPPMPSSEMQGTVPVFLPCVTEVETPEQILKRLKERYSSMEEVHNRHISDRNKVAEDLVTLMKDCNTYEAEGPVLAQRYRFYQELRGYVTDLVECLDEKVPVIDTLEQRLLHLLKKRADDLTERRRQDIRDQAEELSPISRSNATSTQKRSYQEEEARIRRAAEREGRRTRRRRAREMKGTGRHQDGMSSDDEQTELEMTAFKNQRDVIESDAHLVFDDVVDEFCSIRGILSRFEVWRSTDFDAYKEAYVSLCLPKVLGPIIRLKLLMWNPLQETVDFERHKWFDTLLLYGVNDSETEESLRLDPDLKFVPSVVEKVIVPKLHKLVETQWDPMSTSQTLRLVGCMNRLIREYPSLEPNSKPFNQLMSKVIEKMKDAVENDIFIPIYPKQVLEAKGGSGGQFFQRQFGNAVKLLRNLLSWQGIISDNILQQVAVTSLLNRYILAALRTCDASDAAEKCNMIVSTFPRWWFQQQDSNRPKLQLFVNQLKVIAQCLDVSIPSGREAMDNIMKLQQSLESTAI